MKFYGLTLFNQILGITTNSPYDKDRNPVPLVDKYSLSTLSEEIWLVHSIEMVRKVIYNPNRRAENTSYVYPNISSESAADVRICEFELTKGKEIEV